MPVPRRYREKLAAAVYALAVREGDVRERLRGAYFYLRMLSPQDVPLAHRDEFTSIMSALIKRGAEIGPNGETFVRAIDNTMRNMRNSTGRRIAERIYSLNSLARDR